MRFPTLGARPLPPTRLLDRAALAALMLMASLPFLHPHHLHPIPTFFPEWWAALFGFLACLAVLLPRLHKTFFWPRCILMPVALAGMILLQALLFPRGASDMALLAVLYLLWASLLMLAARALMDTYGEKALADALAVGLSVAALASVMLAALQASGTLRGTGWVSPLMGGRLFANLNQPNHLALLLWLGVGAVCYLHATSAVRRALALTTVVLLVLAALLTGSRAVLLYAAALPLFAVLQRWRGPAMPGLLVLALTALASTVIGQLLLPLFGTLSSIDTPGQREWASQGNDGVRWGLWWMALQMGSADWLTGIGWGRFVSQSFADIDNLRAAAPAGLTLVPAEHAHNIGLNLFAELGVLAPLLLGGLFLAWVLRVLRTPRAEHSAGRSFALILILFLFLHAQVEYTLWYSFFLGISALALTLAEPKKTGLPPFRPALSGLVLIAGLAILFMLRADYARLENTMQWPITQDGTPPRPWQQVADELVALRQTSRFSGYVDLSLAGTMRFDREGTQNKLLICRKAIAFSPTDYVVFKCAALLAIDGQGVAAHALLNRALLAYPEKAADFVRSGQSMKKDYPELISLIEAANRHRAAKR